MGRYIARRLLLTVPVFLASTFIIFAMVYAIPGDPVRALSGDRPLPPQVQAELRDRYNLDDPLAVQYAKYMGGLARGDLGEDFNGRPVSSYFAERLPVTLKLTAVAVAFEAVIGILAGVLAGIRRNSYLDNLTLVSTTLLVAVPVFVLGFCLQLLLGLKLPQLLAGVGIDAKPFPIAGVSAGFPQAYLLPGFVLGSLSLAYVARLTRTSLVENLRSDYVRTARAKGLRTRTVIGKHTLRNSLIPVVTYLGIDIGVLMSGAIITEGIFNIPGLGQAVFQGVRLQNGPVVVGIVTALVLVFILANLLVDILYALIDPRIRYG